MEIMNVVTIYYINILVFLFYKGRIGRRVLMLIFDEK